MATHTKTLVSEKQGLYLSRVRCVSLTKALTTIVSPRLSATCSAHEWC
jgi:hypothetical protein